MILGFKQQFVDKILDGSKIHTIREDKTKRWKLGNTIHFATGVRTKNYKQFHEGVCKEVQDFEVEYDEDYVCVLIDGKVFYEKNESFVTQTEAMLQLAKADGFESIDDFFKWFNSPFKGRLIHWTDFVY